MLACAVALVLLMDVSSSVNAERFELQEGGSARALRHPEVAGLIDDGHPVAVTVIQWSYLTATVAEWRILRTQADVASFSDDLARTPRAFEGTTAMGKAIRVGLDAFRKAPCDPERKIIDVSGDGPNNSGEDPSVPRLTAQELGVTINGLPIENKYEPYLTEYYRSAVATDDGFVIPARGFEDVERAMANKLRREIAGLAPKERWASARIGINH